MVRKLLPLVGMLALVGFVGCSGTNAVEGQVTLDGSPVSGAAVTFIPSDNKGQGGSGITDSSGNFSIKAGGKSKGISSGTYKVIVVKTKSTIEGQDPDKMSGGGKGPMGGDYFKMMEKNKGGGAGPPMAGGPPGGKSEPKSELPDQYASEATTPFKDIKVPLVTRPLKLELKSK